MSIRGLIEYDWAEVSRYGARHDTKWIRTDKFHAALPVWTEITDDPKTWPDEPGEYLVEHHDGLFVGELFNDDSSWFENEFSGEIDIGSCTAWRPLCDLDRPLKALEAGK
jgi:hypothetical protein